MKAFEREALALGHDALALNVFAGNRAARALYEQAGYKESSLIMRKDLRADGV